ncbi:MAG: hypothetical protein H7A00_02625 [Hahellaceae bacterium]|nr:hypothetical protein [Hahellaceae bacterium]
MSATLITAVIIVALLGSIAVAAFVRLREQMRYEKQRRFNNLQNRYRRMHMLAAELPPQYLNKELRLMILERALETLLEIKPLKLDPNIDLKIAKDTEQFEKAKSSNEKPQQVNITDPVKAKEVRKLLEILHKFILTQKKKRKIDAATGKKYLEYVSYLTCKARADYFVGRAEDARKAGRPRVAIHNYHNALQEMTPLKENPLCAKSILSYKSRIKDLEALANSDQPKPQAAEDPKKLDKEWTSFMDTDDKWKKKNAYDD